MAVFYLFGVLHHFEHCTGHITTGSWMGRGNQYIQFHQSSVLEAVPGTEPQPQRWEVRVLPICHCGPSVAVSNPNRDISCWIGQVGPVRSFLILVFSLYTLLLSVEVEDLFGLHF